MCQKQKKKLKQKKFSIRNLSTDLKLIFTNLIAEKKRRKALSRDSNTLQSLITDRKLLENVFNCELHASRGESEKGLSIYISKEALRPFSLSSSRHTQCMYNQYKVRFHLNKYKYFKYGCVSRHIFRFDKHKICKSKLGALLMINILFHCN